MSSQTRGTILKDPNMAIGYDACSIFSAKIHDPRQVLRPADGLTYCLLSTLQRFAVLHLQSFQSISFWSQPCMDGNQRDQRTSSTDATHRFVVTSSTGASHGFVVTSSTGASHGFVATSSTAANHGFMHAPTVHKYTRSWPLLVYMMQTCMHTSVQLCKGTKTSKQ